MNSELLNNLHHIEHLVEHGEIEQALKQLEGLSKTYPDNYHITSLLGECYLTLGQPKKAIKPLRWATRLLKKHKTSQQGPETSMEETTSQHNERGEKATVQELKRTFFEKKKANPWLDHYLLGCAYGRCLKLRSAIKHLNIANQMNPDNTEIIRNLGWIRCMQERTTIGRAFLERAIDLDPENALAYNDLGASYMFEENFEEAKKWIGKALELDPQDDFILNTAERLEDLMTLDTIVKKKR